jgi:dimethylamine---corrinoid protein Co-methyltransferase
VGVGDPFGMSLTHAIASGMGGIRTAGDLVARMQLNYRMRLPEAKKYVADKLHVSTFDLSDSTVMRNLREELDIGLVEAVPGLSKGLAAKARIADLLDIKIAAVDILKGQMPA